MRPRRIFADPELLIRRVYAYVAYRIGDGPDAQDITSEAFARALRYQDSFDETRGDETAWLIGIARRVLASSYRTPTLELDDTSLGTEEHEEKTVRRLAVREAMGRLEPKDRELIALRYGADLKAREIAELLDLKTNAVEVALHRAVARLRADVEGEAKNPPSGVVRALAQTSDQRA